MMAVAQSSMRKFNNSEKTESSCLLFKRSEYSQASEIHGVSTLPADENIPHNMQKESNDDSTVTKTLATTITKQSCNDFGDKEQKPAQKKRLNLKKVKSGSQAKSTKGQNESEEETMSSLRNKFQPVFENRSAVIGDELANQISHNEDMKFESNDNEFKCPASCTMQSCPVRRGDISNSHVESDAEWNEHINNCFDSVKTGSTSSKETSQAIDVKELEFCQICQRDMSRYNTIQRQQHVNRCCDSIEETQNHLPVPSAAQKQLPCLICGKLCKTFKSRQSHMKKCAKQNNVSTVQLVKLNRNENNEDPTDNCRDKDSESDTSKVKVGNLGTKEKKKQQIFKSSKRKRDTKLQNKDLDEQIQLALALSASMQSNAEDKGPLGQRARKKRKGQATLPALLLRSDDEAKKVTEARAAAVLCHWADSDDEIQCTPALAPSTLLQKYASESDTYTLDGTDQAETNSDNLEPDNGDQKEIARKYESVDTDVCMSNLEREDKDVLQLEDESLEEQQKIVIVNETPLATTAAENDNRNSLTVNTQTRLWRIASLCTENSSESGFYVPNLLPKTTPRKKKVVIKSGSEAIEGQEECYASFSDDKNTKQDLHFKATTQNDGITESQEKDIALLAKLVSEERSNDMQSNIDEEEMSGELEKTWFPSSGFCVRKDNHGQQNKKIERVDTLLNDLTCMVGNPLLSDVEIIAKDSQKLYAHSFMLAARCKTLATMLHQEKLAGSAEDDMNNKFIPLKMVDIDVRAVHAVMTYIYTASFVPVQSCVMEDVKKLVIRLNLTCAVDEWEEVNENEEVLSDCNGGLVEEDDTDHEESHGNLDVLLKSLWAGEDETENNPEEEDNAFGDSVLDEELDDMEIKIYTQVTPKKDSDSAEERNDTKLHNNKGSKHVDKIDFIDKYVVELASDSDESVAANSASRDLAGEAQNNDSVCDHQQQSNVENSFSSNHLFSPTSSLENSVESIENKDGDTPVDSDDWFIPDTPRPECLSDLTSLQAKSQRSRTEYDNEDGDTPVDSDDWFIPDTPRPECLSDLTSLQAKSQRSRTEYDNEVQAIEDDMLPGDLAKPNNPTRHSKDQAETQRYCLLDPCSFASSPTSQHNSSSKASYIYSSLNKEETCNAVDNLSPPSPAEEITVFLASSNQSFLARNHDNSTMGPQDSVVPKSQKSECHDFENSELASVSSPVLETTENTTKSIRENSMNVDDWLDGSISSSILPVISTPERRASYIENDLNHDDGVSYDNQDFDCYDDGGFNCDIEDYFNADASEREHEDVVVEQVQPVQEKPKSCKKQKKDRPEKGIICKRSRTKTNNKRQQLEAQNSKTPILDYSNMDTPDLTTKLKQYGVRPLAKRKMVIKLKEIYHYTHQDTSSEDETDNGQDQRQATVETAQGDQEKPKKSTTEEKTSAEGCTQDSGESSSGSSGTGSYCDGDLSEEVDVLSQESSISRSKQIMSFLTQNHDLYLKVLKYEPIPLPTLQGMLKDNGIKCPINGLKDFLDEQCITFSIPRTARVRKRQRRAKPKSRKNN